MKKDGFSLIELIIVIAVGSVLIGIVGLSVKKSIERNNYNKIKTIIPKILDTEANKAFEDGEAKYVDLDMDSCYIKTEQQQKKLPENYSYSVYLVARENDGKMTTSGTVKLVSTGTVRFEIDNNGRINKTNVSSETLNKRLHPAILAEKNGMPFARIDIMSSRYITPKIVLYKPRGGTSADMGAEDKWAIDN